MPRYTVVSAARAEGDASPPLEDMLVDARDYSSSSISDDDLNVLNAQNGELEKRLADMHLSLGGNHFGETSTAESAISTADTGAINHGACPHGVLRLSAARF